MRRRKSRASFLIRCELWRAAESHTPSICSGVRAGILEGGDHGLASVPHGCRCLVHPSLHALDRQSTSRIGDCLINYVASAVEWPVPYSTEFKVFGAIYCDGCGSFRDERNQDTYRRLYNLIALARWLVVHTVVIVSVRATFAIMRRARAVLKMAQAKLKNCRCSATDRVLCDKLVNHFAGIPFEVGFKHFLLGVARRKRPQLV
jgi:hypothetical protein